MRFAAITLAASVALVGGAACAPPTRAYTSDTVGVPVTDSVSSVGTGASLLVMQRPERAASIQVCLDSGPDAAASGADFPAKVLNAIAGRLESLDLTDPTLSRGLYVEIWTAAGDGEAGGLLVEANVPDVEVVDVAAGMKPEDRDAALLRKAEQRGRLAAVAHAQAALVRELRSVVIPATKTTDLLRCISRANAQLAGRDPARRLLIVASSLPVGVGTASVRGGLAATRQVMVLGWGAGFAARDEAWRATWASLGAKSNLFVYEVDDGVGATLATAIEGVLR